MQSRKFSYISRPIRFLYSTCVPSSLWLRISNRPGVKHRRASTWNDGKFIYFVKDFIITFTTSRLHICLVLKFYGVFLTLLFARMTSCNLVGDTDVSDKNVASVFRVKLYHI
jgi:hypothetical protein